MDRQKRQTPKLHDITLRRRKCTQRHSSISILVLPTPDFAAKLRAIRVDGIPELGVRLLDVLVGGGGAERCVRVCD